MKISGMFDWFFDRMERNQMGCKEAKAVWDLRGYHLICPEDAEGAKEECKNAVKYGGKVLCLEYPSYRIVE